VEGKIVNKKHRDYEEGLLEALKNPEEALGYLNAALEDKDPRVFLLALMDVLKAQNIDISAFAQESMISRQNIYRMLSQKGNPRWNNLTSIIDSMGWKVQITAK
jgi:probable addiction module antidote protein